MASHFEESLQRDINRIRAKVQEMCNLAERALRDGLAALRDKNRTLAYSVILRDQQIDELEKEVDRLCLEFLVRQQPVAGPLRLAYATIRINLELERVGDYAEAIARQVLTFASMARVSGPCATPTNYGAASAWFFPCRLACLSAFMKTSLMPPAAGA
jgi:phosphate transport system protein